MAAKSKVSFSTPGQPSRVAPVQETSVTRRRIQDVLGQARAALRQSQQFRHVPAESKNKNLGNKLQFQQQPQDDYWSSPGAGGVMTVANAEKEKHLRTARDAEIDDSRSKSSSYRYNEPQANKHQSNQDDFGMPFRDSLKKTPGAPSHPKTPSRHSGGASIADNVSVSDGSTSSISLSTNDLRVSTGSDESSSEASQEINSQVSAKRTIKSATTRSSKMGQKLKEWKVPSTVKLTPLNTAVTGVPAEAFGDIGPPEDTVERGEARDDDDDEVNSVGLPKSSVPSATGKVEKDDMGFSRAHVLKNDEDPHWFEKALLARGESISEAAYKAFKQTQSMQLKQEEEDIINKNVAMAVKKTKGKPIFNNLTDPEYTADWISDGVLTSSLVSEVDMPVSDYIKDDDLDVTKDEVDIDDLVDSIVMDEVNTESMIKTATELEQSGVLDEISENLHSVLDISDHPESQNFSGMSAEEKNFAKEYDEVMQDAEEPLQSIFLDEVPSSRRKGRRVSVSFSGSVGHNEIKGGQQEEEEEEDYDDDTFIQLESTASSVTKSKSLSKRRSSKSMEQSSSTLVSSGKKNDKKTSSSVKSTSVGVKSSKSVKVKDSTTSAASGGSTSEKLKSKSTSQTKSYASTSSTTSKRLNSLPIPPDPPTSRHQKNIQNILEKEVYQKEVKRIRSEKVREEKGREIQRKIAKESLERNKLGAWKDPDYTEILLPELFKYKSLSGLQAAKAKKSILTPGINYGAPYFQMNGAIAGTEGTEAALAAARVESLDIPDLVREVLASNERMYKMTVEASEQMAKKAYKDKVKREWNRKQTVNKKQR